MSENSIETANKINFGLSGRAIAQELDKDLLENLYHHLKNLQFLVYVLAQLHVLCAETFAKC